MKALLTTICPILFNTLLIGCTGSKSGAKSDLKSAPKVANIGLAHWKVTTLTPRGDGKPMNVKPPEISNYANIPELKDFMYNDSTDGSIVFYTYPAVSRANLSYSRSEFREQRLINEQKELIGQKDNRK